LYSRALSKLFILHSEGQFVPMTLTSRFAARSCSLARQLRAPVAARSFTTRTSTTKLIHTEGQINAGSSSRYVRLFSSSAIRKDQTQPAPSAKAYLESGVVKGAANPVNVKKVLVIGSGGLSIGQAGEFDYSGRYSFNCLEMSHSARSVSRCKISPLMNIEDLCYYFPNFVSCRIPST
jgi:carbamoyl-phosphate synthase large subunit